MTKQSRRIAKRLLLPAASLLAMLALFAPAASAFEQHHYGGVVLQPGKSREVPYDHGVIGQRAVGQGSLSVCQWTYNMWHDTEQKTCGAGEAGNFMNNMAWWNDYTMGRITNNSGSAQRVDGYYWTKYNKLASFQTSGVATTNDSGRMYAGEEIESNNWKFRFAMQPDGNAVVYNTVTGKACWHTGTAGHWGAWAGMQPDGNFVIYSSGGVPLYSSGTSGHGNAYMFMQDDGNLVIYKAGTVTPIWATSWITGQAGC